MPNVLIIICLLLNVLFVFTPRIHAIAPPTISVLGPIEPVKLYFNDDTLNQMAEIPPWSVGNHKIGGNYLYLVSGYNTHLCDTIDNMFALSAYTRIQSCKLRQTSAITPNTTALNPSAPLWSRDYYGAFSGHLIETKNQGWQLYTINHGELLNNNYFPSQPCRLAPDLGYGTHPCIPENNDLSYNAFIGMSSFAWTLENFTSNTMFTDRGPIVWPANGYVDNGQKATYLGILHPSSIVKDGYLYVYFRDTSYGTVDGRTAGLKVARAPITDNGVDPLSFKTYFQGQFTDNALPNGFNISNPANITNFFSQKGGRSSALFAGDTSNGHPPDVYRFSVAKLTGTDWYIGVAQDLYMGTTLRLSQDLVNWSTHVVIPGTEYNFYANPSVNGLITQPFMYPRFSDATGDSSDEVDPNDFYVVGTSHSTSPFGSHPAGYVVKQVHLKLASLPPRISPPQSTPGDYTSDGHVNNTDITVVQSNFGNPYTIFDYNSVIEHFEN